MAERPVILVIVGYVGLYTALRACSSGGFRVGPCSSWSIRSRT